MRFVFLVVPILSLSACNAANSEPRSTEADGTRSFTVGSFDAVGLGGSDTVRVVRGANAGVVATGPQRVLDQLNIRVEGSTLKIDRKSARSSWNWGRNRGAIITVTTPGISGASVGGSGDMTVDRADGETFDAAVAGSGNLALSSLSVKRVELNVSGSGNLTLSGSAADAAMTVSGSGNIDARDFESQAATIAATGSGGIRAKVRDRATISVTGSGNADIAGTDNCQIAKTGSGSARCSR